MIIGLAGVKQSGKNTAAKFISDEFGDEFQIKEWSFAAKLKQSAIAALSGQVLSVEDAVIAADELKTDSEFHGKVFDPAEGEDFVIAEYQFSGREFLQWYGTEAHRKVFGDDFWVDQVMKDIPDTWGVLPVEEWNGRLDLVTDVRFPNEAIAITEAGGRVFKITRPDVENTGDTHASEKPLDDELCWCDLLNGGSLDHFKELLRPHVKYAIKEMYEGEYGRITSNAIS